MERISSGKVAFDHLQHIPSADHQLAQILKIWAGRPGNRMRLISRSACFISSMDSFVFLFRQLAQAPTHPACANAGNTGLIAVSSFLSTALRKRMVSGSPAMEACGEGPGAPAGIMRRTPARPALFPACLFDCFLASAAILSHRRSGHRPSSEQQGRR